jgi:hypothetical protein
MRPPDRADLHVSADPVMSLRNAYELTSNAHAALSGGVIAWAADPGLPGGSPGCSSTPIPAAPTHPKV